MKKFLLIFFFATLALASGAQVTINRDPEIKKMVDEISKDRIEQYVRKLVSFHTRHDLSEQNDPAKGIGAAWNWVKEEMDKSIRSRKDVLMSDLKITWWVEKGREFRIR